MPLFVLLLHRFHYFFKENLTRTVMWDHYDAYILVVVVLTNWKKINSNREITDRKVNTRILVNKDRRLATHQSRSNTSFQFRWIQTTSTNKPKGTTTESPTLSISKQKATFTMTVVKILRKLYVNQAKCNGITRNADYRGRTLIWML